MLAGEIYGPKQIRLVDAPEPELDPGGSGQIIFQPELTCLCGSDMLFFEQKHEEYKPRLGHSLHEMIGRVVGEVAGIGSGRHCRGVGSQP